MDYSSGTFGCDSFSLEYSRIFHIPKSGQFCLLQYFFWNIPYSRKARHYHVEQFFWNIPFREISYSMEYSIGILDGIFHSFFESWLMEVGKFQISRGYPCSPPGVFIKLSILSFGLTPIFKWFSYWRCI